MVAEAGLEPARSCLRGILSPLCLPIPPLGHFSLWTIEFLHNINMYYIDSIFASLKTGLRNLQL